MPVYWSVADVFPAIETHHSLGLYSPNDGRLLLPLQWFHLFSLGRDNLRLCQAVSYLPPFPPRNHTSTQSSLTVALSKFVLVTHWVPEQLYSVQWSPAVPDKYTCPVVSVHQCCLPEFGSVHLLVYWTGSVLSAWWAVEWTGWSTFSAPVPFSQQFIERIGPSHLFGRWPVRVNISGVFFDLSIGIWSLSRSRSFWCFAIEVCRRRYMNISLGNWEIMTRSSTLIDR